MTDRRDRVFAVWRRTASLSWPVAIQQTFNTLMRTTDVLVTGLFSPAAVAAVGLADLYAEIPMRAGFGLGAGAIALASQDTGRGANTPRDRAITQALLIGFLVGLPFVAIGVLFGEALIAVLGAPPEVTRMGGAYLAIIFAIAPARIVGLVGSRALQGTGDTRTPMYVNVASNAINIVGSVGLGLGLGPFPRLGIVGVGLATAIGRTFTAVVLVLAIASNYTTVSFAKPRSATATRQLVAVSLPKFAEGMSSSAVSFPFNAILLGFGTEVNAAYHIARRIFHQVTGPLYRSYGVVSSIVVGQALGAGDPDGARFSGFAIAALGFVSLGLAGGGMAIFAETLVTVFTADTATVGYAAGFTRSFGVGVVFLGVFYAFAGGLQGAGDTRTPFLARLSAEFGFMLGCAYLVGVVLGYGLVGIYAAIVLSFLWRAVVVTHGFAVGDWADRAGAMIAERDTTVD